MVAHTGIRGTTANRDNRDHLRHRRRDKVSARHPHRHRVPEDSDNPLHRHPDRNGDHSPSPSGVRNQDHSGHNPARSGNHHRVSPMAASNTAISNQLLSPTAG